MRRSTLAMSAVLFAATGALAADPPVTWESQAKKAQATAGPSSSGAPPSKTASPSATGDDSLLREVQQSLKEKGHDPGPVDGKLSDATRRALEQFQKSRGLEASGAIDDPTLAALGVRRATS